MNVPARGFTSHRPADTWEEALISGNGTIGALVMSQPLDETIILTHERLYMPWYKIFPLVDLSGHLDEIRRLISAGQYHAATRLAQDHAYNYGYDDEFRWPDPFVPAFDLLVKMQSNGPVREYARSLDWAPGVVTVHYADDGGSIKRRLFVSRADQVAVLSITAPSSNPTNCELALAPRPSETDDGEPAPLMAGIANTQITVEAPWISYQSSFSRSYHGSIQGYEGLARVITDGQTTQTMDQTIRISNAQEVVVLVWLDVLYELEKSQLAEQKVRLDQLDADFDHLLNRHEQIHGEIFSRMRLDLGGSEADRVLSSEELCARSKRGNLNKALIEKQFDAGRYGILSSSGDWPPALQGIWTGTWQPAWQGDFTLDGNVQAAIASSLMGNMRETMEAYLSYTESFLPHYRENARQIYGYRGILMPSRTSAHGYLNHLSMRHMWFYWTACAPWAAHYFHDYYLYTGDQEFLFERALPFMKEIALFYEDFLYEGPNGKLVFNPSYSPENTPRNSNTKTCLNATMDIGLAKEFFTNLIAICEQHGLEERGVTRWQSLLAKMPGYMLNEDGAIKEWTTEDLADEYTHRHAAHLCHLIDWLPADIVGDPALVAGFHRALELRMKTRRQDIGVMAFGITELGQVATNLRDARLAYEAVDMVANCFWRATNMTPTHDPDHIFNMDTAGGLPAVIIQMLVASRIGEIDLLPALPPEWPFGTIEGVLCRGQIEIKALSWREGQITVQLISEIAQQVKISVPGSFKNVTLGQGHSALIERHGEDGQCLVAMPPGELVEVNFDC